MQGHVYIVAVESSGDHLGAGLAEALRAQSPDVRISAIGGKAMNAQGVESELDITGLSILGFSEALRAYPLVRKRVREAVALILTARPDAVVLIDSWGFMIRVAQGLKRAGFTGQIVKYVAPQVWAMREGRSATLAKSIDHLLSIHSFDAPYFEKHGLSVTHVGNPMFDTDFSVGDASGLRARIGAAADTPICAVFFGSRQSEFTQLREPIGSAVKILSARYPNMVFVSPVSQALRETVTAARDDDDMARIHLLDEADKFGVFATATVAIACSGTVTTQLAFVGIASVVAYKVAPLTWWAGKKLYKPDYISLVNISAGTALMPEFLQDEASGENIAGAIATLMDDESLRTQRAQALRAQAQIMQGSGGSASESAARKIIELIN